MLSTLLAPFDVYYAYRRQGYDRRESYRLMKACLYELLTLWLIFHPLMRKGQLSHGGAEL